VTLSLLGRHSSPPLVPTTMPSLPNELWWKILAHATSFESNLAMVKPSSEHLYPFFPGSFPGFSNTHFYSSQLAIWKRSIRVAHNFVQVNRLWRGIAERFLYSAFYVEKGWRVKRFIDTVKQNPNLAEQLRTLVIMPPIDVTTAYFGPLVVQVLSLCHGIVAIVVQSYLLSSSLPLFQFPDSSRRLQLLSTRFPAFMINSNNYTSLQVLELSVDSIRGSTSPSFPDHITFPSLHTLILEFRSLDQRTLNVIGKWELPSLKELSISQWIPHISIPLLPLIRRSYERLEFFNTCLDFLHDRAFHDIIRAPPFHLRNISFDLWQSTYPTPPMYPATKLFLDM